MNELEIQRSPSQRFINKIKTEAAIGTSERPKLNEYETIRAQMLFHRVEMEINTLEAKRQLKNPSAPPIVWKNIDVDALSITAYHRIKSGLCPITKNHLSVIPRFIKATGKYNIDLKIGFKGEDFISRRLSLYPIKDINYQLVHEHDHFKPVMKSAFSKIETYEFRIDSPFDRGKIIGGFGYIEYAEGYESLNKLVIVTNDDFEKSRKNAETQMVWGPHPEKMKFKTIVWRTTSHIVLDPSKMLEGDIEIIQNNDIEIQEIDELPQGISFDDTKPPDHIIDATRDDNSGNAAQQQPAQPTPKAPF